MQATARDLLKTIKDPDVRRFAAKDLKEEQKKERLDLDASELANKRRLDQLRRDGAALNPDDGPLGLGARSLVREGKELVHGAEGSAGALIKLFGAGGTLAGVLVGAILPLLKETVDTRVKEIVDNRTAELEARIQRIEFDANFAARNRDPIFEQEQSTAALKAILDAEGRGKHWHDEGDAVLESGG